MEKFQRTNKCRLCKERSTFIDVFSLGDQYVTDFPTPDRIKDGILAPLDLVLCTKCNLLQLRHTVERDEMYKQYWYKSGTNQTMRDALKNVVDSAMQRVELTEDDIVIDIGSNDGTLLSYWPEWVKRVGFEPARNLWAESVNKVKMYRSFNDYFKYVGERAKVITSIAMLYDLDDPDDFVHNIYASLADGGIWINQMNYLSSMLENNNFDNISHEHVAYYSLNSLETLLDRHNMRVIDVELNDINGGSFRTYIARKDTNYVVNEANIQPLRDREEAEGITTLRPYLAFWERIKKAKKQTYDFIKSQVAAGKVFYLYGASTRGHVILQFYGLDKKLIKGAAERNPDKYGLVTIGTGIPIMSEADVRAANPDYMLVLPYFFRKEFISREKDYLDRGGKLIFPLPEFEVVDAGVFARTNA